MEGWVSLNSVWPVRTNPIGYTLIFFFAFKSICIERWSYHSISIFLGLQKYVNSERNLRARFGRHWKILNEREIEEWGQIYRLKDFNVARNGNRLEIKQHKICYADIMHIIKSVRVNFKMHIKWQRLSAESHMCVCPSVYWLLLMGFSIS